MIFSKSNTNKSCTSKYCFTLILTVIVLAALPSSTNSLCCNSHYPGFCSDCSNPLGLLSGYIISSCPAVKGDCNVFGCNCVGGCRQPPFGRKGCAPTAHLNAPRLAVSESSCYLMGEDEKCNGQLSKNKLKMGNETLPNPYMK